MTERSDPINREQEGRLRIIDVFRKNFRRFLDEEKPTIKLISLFFLPEMDEPTISSFDGEIPAHVKYDGIDKEFEKIIERYRKSGSEPMDIPPDTFKLVEFEGISDRLKAYVGKDIKVKRTIYGLVSLPGENSTVGKTIYYSPEDANCKQPIEEIWTAMRSEEQNDPASKDSRPGSALERPPLIHPKLSLIVRR